MNGLFEGACKLLLPGALWLLAAGAGAAGDSAARHPRLSLPAACEIGRQCFVQNYFDHEAGAAARDYACGLLTYDGHKGTDIRLADLQAMNQAVQVLAAAAGRVRAVRDGMDDISVRAIGKDAVKGREAGNSVVIVHGDGWETQYSHLRRGSVLVKAGEEVQRGQPLGMIGLSGFTEFPHLHFEARFNGRSVDPFVGVSGGTQCGTGKGALWTSEALARLAYVPTGVISAGFAGDRLTLADVEKGEIAPPRAAAGAMLFYIYLYGARAGDEEQLRIVGPGGRVIAEKRSRVPGNKAVWLSFAGRKRDGAAWSAGVYRGEYALQRLEEGQLRQVVSVTREVTIADDRPTF